MHLLFKILQIIILINGIGGEKKNINILMVCMIYHLYLIDLIHNLFKSIILMKRRKTVNSEEENHSQSGVSRPWGKGDRG